MNKDEIKEMHREAREILEILPTLSESGKRIAINCFKKKWWNIEPENALKIGGSYVR